MPHYRHIVVRVIGNTAALEANLLPVAIDRIAGELGLTLDQVNSPGTSPRITFPIRLQTGVHL